MKILNLFSLYPDDLLPICLQKTKIGLDFAAHNLQEAIMKGFLENDADFHIVNAPAMGSYPPYSRMIKVPSYQSPDGLIDSVSYYNISLFKRYSKVSNIRRKVLEWCEENKGEQCVVVFYNVSNLAVAKDVKNQYPGVKTCIIVTDLVEYMSTKKDLKSDINDVVSKIISSSDNYGFIDSFILLAEPMKERLPVGEKPYLHMEGIYNSDDSTDVIEKKEEKVILYTGSLGMRYGIKDLVHAFQLIKQPNYRLWVRGNGECEQFVKNASIGDSRIKYFDRMSREDLLRLEKSATLLVNPVHSSATFTRFFFPSKTLEYMASGTPTLMSKLSCIPEDYNDFLYFFDDESIEGMSRKMFEICEKSPSELGSIGKAASVFIRENKTPKPQTRRMLDFFETLF